MLSTYFLAPTGSDAGSGTEESPWQTLQHANMNISSRSLQTQIPRRAIGSTSAGAQASNSPSAVTS